jgi:hypothetical protein
MTRMKRSRFVLALVVVLTSAACSSPAPASGPAGTSAAAGTAAAPTTVATTAPLPSASSAPDPTVWLCKPGLASDPCAGNLDATAVGADGTTTILPGAPADDPPVDCFYVYPTVSRQATVNANLKIDAEEAAVAQAQAAQFSRVCHVYAPMYRQLTLAAIKKPSAITIISALTAYGDVASAFREYLARYNHGRGVVFIGHSQGSMMLTAMLRAEVEARPEVLKLLVSAIIPGGNVEVPVGKTVGGDFADISACTSTEQIGCVVAYSTFAGTPPAGAVFGRIATALRPFQEKSSVPLRIMCVNPAAPGGGVATLEPDFPSSGIFAASGKAAGGVTARTPFVTFPSQYSAHCVEKGGASWLQIDRLGGKTDIRAAAAKLVAPTWGLHPLDISIAEGDLVDLVRTESAAYAQH